MEHEPRLLQLMREMLEAMVVDRPDNQMSLRIGDGNSPSRIMHQLTLTDRLIGGSPFTGRDHATTTICNEPDYSVSPGSRSAAVRAEDCCRR